MDLISGPSRVQGKDCIFVVVDRLTKYVHFFAIYVEFKAIKLHGLPTNIVSHRDISLLYFS